MNVFKDLNYKSHKNTKCKGKASPCRGSGHTSKIADIGKSDGVFAKIWLHYLSSSTIQQ